MELKWEIYNVYRRATASSNRTFMELKLRAQTSGTHGDTTF